MRRKERIIKSLILGVFVILYVVSGSAYADNSGAAFLKIGVGARSVGMGNTYIAIARDVTAAFWNPAGLSYLSKREISAMHTTWIADMNFDYLGYAYPLKNGKVLGLSFISLNTGTIEGRDENRNKTSDFTAYDACVILSYSRALFNKTTLGINLKLIQQKIADEKANGIAFDIGQMYQMPIKNLTLGVAIYNIGPKMKFIEEGYNLPLTVGTGLGYTIGGLTLALDVKHQIIDNKFSVSFGTEYAPINILSLRAGYLTRLFSLREHYAETSNDIYKGSTGLGAGLGLRLGGSTIDYAFVPYGVLGNTHRISIGFKY